MPMPDSYNLLEAAQILARFNNDNTAVHCAYRKRRRLCRKLKIKSKLPKKMFAVLDWQAAECEARPVRVTGLSLPEPPATKSK